MIPFVPPSFVIGSIIIWSGTIASIPSNWHQCNGAAGTPNLRNKFVRCAQDQAAIGNTGGSDSQDHTFLGDGHFHIMRTAPPNEIQIGSGLDNLTSLDRATGTTDASDNRPAFYELMYIQRVA